EIWATEEIVLPSLVSLLGYEIVQNPCSQDFVRYEKTFTLQDITAAQSVSNAFWIHPIETKYDDGARKFARELSSHYKRPNGYADIPFPADLFMTSVLLANIKHIEGWLSNREAELLAAITLKACNSLKGPHRIVEIGSYQGKSTVVLGTVAKAFFPKARVFAIDPHEGMVGASDQAIQQVPPTLEKFKRNIENAGLTEVVALIKD